MMAQSIAFDRAADYYDQTRAFPPGDEKRAAALLVRAGRFTAADRVLEIGVGTGRIALPLAPHVGAIFGIDLSLPMMQRLASKRTSEAIYLTHADATRLPFDDDTFDGALSVHVFHLIPNWRAAVAEAARVLKPGKPLVSAWSEKFHKDSWWTAWNSVQPPEQEKRFGLKFGQYGTFLSELGWTPLSDQESEAYTHYQSPQAFLDQLRQRIWSSTWHLSEAQIEAGIEAVLAVMRSDGEDLNTPVPVTTHFHTRAFVPPQ
jgi:ubiquinone/menaquinone biosynthesis C-methylase UbiE